MSLISLFALAYFLGLNAFVHIVKPKVYPFPAALAIACLGSIMIGVVSN